MINHEHDPDVCLEKYNGLVREIETHNKRLDSHSDDIQELQRVSAARTTEVNNICKSINDLNTRIDKLLDQNRNLMLMMLTALIGFFIFCVEQGIFHK
jgi:flagellar hook-associated protein FlgK